MQKDAVINNFNSLETRNDIGGLWENFMITERLKTRCYKKIYANQYFWRTWRGLAEIDLIEEHSGKLYGYEFKSRTKPHKPVIAPKQWQETYGDQAKWQLVSPSNALDFLEITT